MQVKTKSAVIAEAARIIATHHPNQRSYLSRWETRIFGCKPKPGFDVSAL
jgi:hypothetical protein